MNEPKKKQYWFLLAASFAVTAVVTVAMGGTTGGSLALARFVGSVIGGALFPLLAMRFISNKAGWIVFAIFTFGYLQGEFNFLGVEDEKRATSIAAQPFRYTAKDCEFSVEFPEKPSTKIFTLPEVGDYEQALWISQVPEDSTALRTECLNIPSLSERMAAKGNKEFMLEQLATFATGNGLTSVEYEYALKEIGPTGEARGIKTIQGTPVTYRIMLVIGNKSLLALYAGGKSSSFPQREISPFLDSVRQAQ